MDKSLQSFVKQHICKLGIYSMKLLATKQTSKIITYENNTKSKNIELQNTCYLRQPCWSTMKRFMMISWKFLESWMSPSKPFILLLYSCSSWSNYLSGCLYETLFEDHSLLIIQTPVARIMFPIDRNLSGCLEYSPCTLLYPVRRASCIDCVFRSLGHKLYLLPQHLLDQVCAYWII